MIPVPAPRSRAWTRTPPFAAVGTGSRWRSARSGGIYRSQGEDDPGGLSGRGVRREKTQAAAGMISGGFFVCRREIFNYLDDREDAVFEQGPMQSLVRNGQMMVYEHKGFWQPMDTARDYALLNSLYNEGKAPWVTWP